MQFEISRCKIEDFKTKTNYRKNQIYKGISMIVWGRWIKHITSPNISSLEQTKEHGELNPAELAIAILELREEYREKVMHNLYLIAIANLLYKQYFRILGIYFHVLILKQRKP